MRKIIIIGIGVRHSDSIQDLERFIYWCKIPFVHTKPAHDILPDSVYNCGNVGLKGDDDANDMFWHSDVIYAIGCSMATQLKGYENEKIPKTTRIIEINENIKETLHYFRVHKLPV